MGRLPKMPVVETLPMDTSPGSVRYWPHRKMFLRSNRRFKDGKENRYRSVVEDLRVAGGPLRSEKPCSISAKSAAATEPPRPDPPKPSMKANKPARFICCRIIAKPSSSTSRIAGPGSSARVMTFCWRCRRCPWAESPTPFRCSGLRRSGARTPSPLWPGHWRTPSRPRPSTAASPTGTTDELAAFHGWFDRDGILRIIMFPGSDTDAPGRSNQNP